MFHTRSTDEHDAREIVSWRYGPPYELYNITPDDRESVAQFTDPSNAYYSVRDDSGDLIAFICLGPDARVAGGDYSREALDVGAGIRPDRTGQGLGPEIIRLAMDIGAREHAPARFRATIAEFNGRAQRAAQKAGLIPVASFRRPSDGLAFVILEGPGRAGED